MNIKKIGHLAVQALMGLAGMLFLFGLAAIFGQRMETYPDEGVVILSESGEWAGINAIRLIATPQCVMDGYATAIYVKDVGELRAKAGPIRLYMDAEAMTYRQAQAREKASHAAIRHDPGCSRYFIRDANER